MNFDEIWTFLLELTASIIVPVWNDLIQYIPLLLAALLIVSIAGLAWYWQRNWAANASRVPMPVPSGRKPADMHLPGPSLWPFVGPIGLLFMLFSLALGVLDTLGNLLLFGLGLTIGVIGVLGWYLDAGKEYEEVEAGGHAQLAAEVAAGPPAWSLEPPPGVHMPGPSAWPFLAPVGLFFIVAGLIFGPVMIVGGLAMGAIASIGWLRDADKELIDVEAHGHATPESRDPEKAWPRALIPIYVGIAGTVLVLTLLPWAISLLPGSSSEATVAGPPPTDTPYISASTVTEFEVTEIAVFANEPFVLTFENKQVGVPHNVAFYDSPAQEVEFFVGEIFDGPAIREYDVEAVAAGTYFYVCSVHPPMTGTLYVK